MSNDFLKIEYLKLSTLIYTEVICSKSLKRNIKLKAFNAKGLQKKYVYSHFQFNDINLKTPKFPLYIITEDLDTYTSTLLLVFVMRKSLSSNVSESSSSSK